MTTTRPLRIALAAALFIPAAAFAQDKATAVLHGHVNNAASQNITSGEIKATKERLDPKDVKKWDVDLQIDKSGDYTGSGIYPGHYYVYVFTQDKYIDRLEIDLAGGDNKALDFDMSRAEFIAKMSDEDKKALEEYKKKTAEANKANIIVNQLNNTLKQTRANLSAAAATKGDVSADVANMKAATDAKPDAAILWITYGDTLLAQGDHLAAADRKAGKSPASDSDAMKLYADAADSYKKGVDLDAASKKPNPHDEAVAYNQMGKAFANAGKVTESSAAYDSAAKVDPASAGMYYNNAAAVLVNANQGDAALAAAQKAIDADPTRPDPYYIKGQVLLQKATVDPKTGMIVPAPGTVEAYQTYLALVNGGGYSADVKAVLESMGQKVDTSFKAPKAKK